MKVITRIVMPAHIVFETLTFKNVDLENVGQGHVMRNNAIIRQISTYKLRSVIFVPDLQIFEILPFQMFHLKNLGQSQRGQHS